MNIKHAKITGITTLADGQETQAASLSVCILLTQYLL